MIGSFLVGAATSGSLGRAAAGVRRLDVSDAGAATLHDPLDVGPNPMFLAIGEDGLVAIAHEDPDEPVSVWRMDGSALMRVSTTGPAEPGSACHVAFASREVVVAASYGAGWVSALVLAPGEVSASTLLLSGSGVHTTRQEAPHPHQLVLDRDRRRLLVPDLGTDQVHVLHLAADGTLRHHHDIQIHPGAGPRHLAIYGGCAVLANELDRTASVVDLVSDVEAGWTSIGTDVPARGAGLSAIRLTRAGTVLIADRDLDGVHVLRVSPTTAGLTHLGSLKTAGRHPRDMELTRDERFLVVAEQASDTITVVGLADGLPTGIVDVVETASPTCIARIR